jgi:rhamnosyl/mannosyltransferase
MPLKLNDLKERLSEYDLVHLHGPVPTFSDAFLLGGLRGMGRKRPHLVYTHHSPIELTSPVIRPFLSIYNYLQERWSNLADHVVASTHSYGQRLSRYVPAEKLSVIPWGVDFNKFFAPVDKNHPFTILYLGQIRPYKGLPVFLKAADHLADTRVWVIGDGHYTETCQKMASKLKIPDLTFWGRVPDEKLLELIKQCHVIVLPSVTRSEAFGIALLEGMAAGLVPVASHLPGVADLIGNEGFTFPPGNANALHQTLIRLRDDPILRVHLAQLAQQKARLYPWERSVFGYERIFANLIENNSLDSITKPIKYPSVPNRI